MAEILCEDCLDFRRCCEPHLAKVCFGHCQALEYPFLLAISKKARNGAFTPPRECKYFHERRSKTA